MLVMATSVALIPNGQATPTSVLVARKGRKELRIRSSGFPNYAGDPNSPGYSLNGNSSQSANPEEAILLNFEGPLFATANGTQPNTGVIFVEIYDDGT